MLTPDNVRALYGVDADVHRHAQSGHLVVVPISRVSAMTAATRFWIIIPLFGLFTAVVILLAPTLGSTPISLARVFDPQIPWAENVDAQIFFIARLPRVLAGALVGSTLAAAGVVLQALLRNPLATPFTLGVSAGAALGAMLAIAFQLDVGVLGATSVPTASFAGALIGTGHRVLPGHARPRRTVDNRDSARRGDTQRVFLGRHHLRAVRDRYGRLVPDGAVAPRQSRREQLSTDSRDHATLLLSFGDVRAAAADR